MRLSRFHIKVLWLIGLVILITLAFKISMESIHLVIVAVYLKVISILVLIIWSIGLSNTLKDLVAFKYKITIDNGYIITAKYLTIWWMFIPYWRPVKTELKSYKYQNMFGAKLTNYYSDEVWFINEQAAEDAIEDHKLELRANRKEWFEISKPSNKISRYL
jgi:hypothetical protein